MTTSEIETAYVKYTKVQGFDEFYRAIRDAERLAKIEILEKELHAIYNIGFSLGRIKDQIAELKETI